MTTTCAIELSTRLVGLRLHQHRGPGGVAASTVQALLDLQARARQRDADDRALRELIVAARAKTDAIPGQVTARLDEIAAIAVELGLGIAREIVGVALDRGLVDPTPTVARCLADCVHGSDRADLVVRLHPDDLAGVAERLEHLPEIQDELAAAKLVADPRVPRGGVRAETGAGRLRYDPNEVLGRICDEVRREANS
jgi:flagellar biosynthesis/type III secretory pathway protein FliH